MEQTHWTNKLKKIGDTPYFRADNGNIYCKHCLFIQSGPLHAVQISESLKKLFGHTKFVINTIITDNKYACKTFIWFDNEEDFEKIMNREVIIEPIELDEEQINSIPSKEVVDGKYFSVIVSPAFITPGSSEGDKDDQFFINSVPHPSKSEELLHLIFDRFAISSPRRKVELKISEKVEKKGDYWALIDFQNRYDCAFAFRLTQRVTCRLEDGSEYRLNVRYGKNVNNSFHYRKTGRY